MFGFGMAKDRFLKPPSTESLNHALTLIVRTCPVVDQIRGIDRADPGCKVISYGRSVGRNDFDATPTAPDGL
jgi:hypothetical protein